MDWVTLHPGEASRLLRRRIFRRTDQQLLEPVQKFGGTILLKGAGTLIATDDELFLCPLGNPGMSVGGMGDVLGGVIAI